MDAQTDISNDRDVRSLYEKLEDRCVMRDQIGASEVYYDLIRAGRPLQKHIRRLYVSVDDSERMEIRHCLKQVDTERLEGI